MPAQLVLASQSPRRLEILRTAGFHPVVRPAHVPEVRRPGEDAVAYVRRLAAEKAAAVEGDLVLAADTVVELEGEVLEKPRDAADARRMLESLSGKLHRVHTGVSIRFGLRSAADHSTTTVSFRRLAAPDIDEYVATGEPMDKAGAYAIQGRACRFVERIDGCYFNVVGLPISLVWHRLRELGAYPLHK